MSVVAPAVRLSQAEVAEVYACLDAGQSAQEISAGLQLRLADVMEIRQAWQSRRPTPEPAAAVEPPDLRALRRDADEVVRPRQEVKNRIASATELLVRADGIDDKRIQSALARARKAMTDLAGLVATYEETTAARAKVAELKAQLAEARAALRGAAPAARRTADGDTPPQRVDAKAVRAWAAEHGVTCSSSGRPPKPVVEAYLAAVGQ